MRGPPKGNHIPYFSHPCFKINVLKLVETNAIKIATPINPPITASLLSYSNYVLYGFLIRPLGPCVVSLRRPVQSQNKPCLLSRTLPTSASPSLTIKFIAWHIWQSNRGGRLAPPQRAGFTCREPPGRTNGRLFEALWHLSNLEACRWLLLLLSSPLSI